MDYWYCCNYHLLVLILKGKNTGSSLLRLTICGLTLHSWLFIEIKLNGIAFSGAALKKFTLAKVNIYANLVKKHLLINPNILYFLIFNYIFNHQNVGYNNGGNCIIINTKIINIPIWSSFFINIIKLPQSQNLLLWIYKFLYH